MLLKRIALGTFECNDARTVRCPLLVPPRVARVDAGDRRRARRRPPVVRADLPGIPPGEVKLEVEDDILTISGEHTESKAEKDENYVRRERRYGSFSRSMTLPVGIKQIKAKTHDGVVEVTIPLPMERRGRALRGRIDAARAGPRSASSCAR